MQFQLRPLPSYGGRHGPAVGSALAVLGLKDWSTAQGDVPFNDLDEDTETKGSA